MTLEEIETFLVPGAVISKTEESLRHAGVDGYELFVLWSGNKEDSVFQVTTAHVPRQNSYRSKHGLMVRIEGPALHRLNAWLLEHDEMLAAQVHAHPTDAYHSETDDSYPIVTTLGGLSLVVPDFCQQDLFTGSAAYRLTRDGWREDARLSSELITVI